MLSTMDTSTHLTGKKIQVRCIGNAKVNGLSNASALAGLHFECGSKLGCRSESLRKMARSAQRKANMHPASRASLETLAIPPSYLQSAIGDNLLLWDSGYSTELRRSFLLGTTDNMNVLSSCDNLIIILSCTSQIQEVGRYRNQIARIYSCIQ